MFVSARRDDQILSGWTPVVTPNLARSSMLLTSVKGFWGVSLSSEPSAMVEDKRDSETSFSIFHVKNFARNSIAHPRFSVFRVLGAPRKRLLKTEDVFLSLHEDPFLKPH